MVVIPSSRWDELRIFLGPRHGSSLIRTFSCLECPMLTFWSIGPALSEGYQFLFLHWSLQQSYWVTWKIRIYIIPNTHAYIMCIYIYILLVYVCLGPLRYLNICSPFRVRSFWTPSGWGNGCVTTTTNWVLASGKRESGWEAHPLSSWNMRKNVGNRQQLEVLIGNSSINRGRGYTIYTWIVEISKFIKMIF